MEDGRPARPARAGNAHPLHYSGLAPLIAVKTSLDARINQIPRSPEPLNGCMLASNSQVISRTLILRHRQMKWFSGLVIVCFACILQSTTVQATHFCGSQAPNAQCSFRSGPASSAAPVCLTCLMAPSMSALILLVAFLVMSRSTLFVGGLQMCPKPILCYFRLYIRPPPFALA